MSNASRIIEVSTINSAGIQAFANESGATYAEVIATGDQATLYAVMLPGGRTVCVLNTNAEPVWEDSDSFASDCAYYGFKLFRIREESGASEIIVAADLEQALAKAKEWSSEGIYDERVMVPVYAAEIDADDEVIEGAEAYGEVEAGPLPKPPATECGAKDHDHDWVSPYPVVGGIKENPGVWSEGGTRFRYLEVCSRCGLYREIHTAGAQRNPGELPETIEYRPADAKSLAWVEREREQEEVQ